MSCSLPVLLGNISVVDIIEGSLAMESSVSSVRALNVSDVHQVSDWLGSLASWMGTSQVINVHLVANKFIRCWLYVFKGLEFVARIEGVGGLTRRLELVDAGNTLLNIPVGKVVLGLIQFKVKHARTSSSHIGC